MSTPAISHWISAVPKEGSGAGDYEDAAAVAVDAWPVCAAVADGATESAFARTWAKRLVRGIVDGEVTTADALRDAVPGWQAEWQAAARERAMDRPWYVAAKAAEGAFAAVLGLSLHADGRWRAVSVGDCCLFQVRDGTLVRSWPFAAADAFTSRPALVASTVGRELPSPDATTGVWQAGDQFLLATDAVAAWLMEEGGGDVSPLDRDAFRERVASARATGALRNDDATLLVLELGASSGAAGEAAEGS